MQAADSITLTGALTSTSVTAGVVLIRFLLRRMLLLATSISGAAGADDTLNLLSSSVSAVSTTIKGGAGADVVSLYGANDVVFDVSSGDSVFGGTGADTMLFTGSVTEHFDCCW